MKTIIAGSRDCFDTNAVDRAVLGSGFDITEIVSGGCRGADQSGELFAERNGIPVKRFPYLGQYGRAGGPIRNDQMARYADALIAIWDGRSRGTKNMIDLAKKHGLRVYVHMVALVDT